MRATVLEQVLAEDGIVLPGTGGAEKSIKCFSPNHNDDTPSMSVNVGKGVYNCHGCGINGNAYTYLTEIRGLEPKAAMEVLERHGATEKFANALQKQDEADREKANRLPRTTREIYNKAKISKDVLADRVMTHEYKDAEGTLVFAVGRFEAWRDDKQTKDKTFRPFTPKADGDGYWVVGPRSEQLPLSERIDRYPIYRTPEIMAAVRSWEGQPDGVKRQIWLVEGEKCADLIARLKIKDGVDPPPVCALYGGSKHPIEHHDLSALYGQRVLLLADADKNGRAYMKKLGNHLAENNVEVRYFLPPGDDAYDVGDAAAQGWPAVLEFIRKGGGVQSHLEVSPVKEPDETTLPQPPMEDSPYFRVMGFEGSAVVLQSKITHRIHKINAASLSNEGNLIHLAPLHFWRALAGGKDPQGKHRSVWADMMIRAAEKQGEMSTQSTYMWERGAHRTRAGKIVYNVGRFVLEEDDQGMMSIEKPLTQDVQSSEIYLPGPAIDLKDDRQAYEYAADLYEAVLAYRWEQQEHGQAFMGWVVTSLVGGALPFRPMLWLTALAGSGKTYLLEQVLNPIFGNLCTDWANATEAGMAFQTQNTALPAYLDEFEPQPGRENRMRDILALIRIATSGGAGRVRGDPRGGVVQSRPRFSLLMASIDRPVLSEADAQRIMPIRLSTASVPNWPEVRDRIHDATTPERCLAVRTHIIRNTAKIVRHAKEIEDELIHDGAPTRDAQIRGALSAGVSFLSAEEGFRLGRRAPTMTDEYRPFLYLMQSPLRSKFGEDVLVADALQQAYFNDRGLFVEELGVSEDEKRYRALAAKYGFKFLDEETLACAVDWRAMKDLLQGTPYASIDLSEYLLRLPGAFRARTENGHLVRHTFAGLTRSVIALPRAELKRMGLFL